MTTAYGLHETDETDEMDEIDEAFDEAVRNRAAPRRPVQTASRQTAFRPPPRPGTDMVTQAQLQAALARVNAQIATNSTAIKTVDARTRALSTEQARLTVAVRKEIADRKKEEEVMRREVQAAKELAVILPLIAKDNPLIGLLALGSGGSLFGGSSTDPNAGYGSNSTGNVVFLAAALGGFGKKA